MKTYVLGGTSGAAGETPGGTPEAAGGTPGGTSEADGGDAVATSAGGTYILMW